MDGPRDINLNDAMMAIMIVGDNVIQGNFNEVIRLHLDDVRE